jgi:bifunctional non-homologous end joining protein LigD
MIKPMLARLIDEPFDKAGWLFEIKWDGYRAIAEIKKDKIKLYSRNGNPFEKIYTPVVEALKKIKNDCILDGEIVALKDGHADFHTLQQYRDVDAPLQYQIFDILSLDGKDLRKKPLIERKKLLAKLLPKKDPILQYSDHIEKFGTKLFDRIKKEGVEGVVAKEAASPYRDGLRNGEWLKIKSVQEQEAIIVGFTAPRGSRKQLGALVLAAHEGGRLRYIGHSGGGFTEKELAEIHAKLKKISTKKSPLTEKVPVNSPITWVAPKYVCEIKFTQWTPEGHMRHPIYVGMRPDKKPKEVVVELPSAPERVELTHRDKIYWPKEVYTKGDLLDYYEKIAPTLLPYLKDRPENLNRHPNGIEGKNFYQKNFTNEVPEFVDTKKIFSESNNAYLRYVICNNTKALLYLVNLGCIELNPWNSRVDSLEYPDYMILDLDPHGRPWKDLIKVAQEVKKILDIACEKHYIKTSGKTGLHIIVPMGARYQYDRVREFAELIMRIVNRALPEITTLERNPKKRGGKLYLDYLQNRNGQTLACAYSVRPYPGASVSTPLEWNEVTPKLDPSKFTIKTIAARLKKKGDLWQGALSHGVDLSEAIRCLEEHLAL